MNPTGGAAIQHAAVLAVGRATFTSTGRLPTYGQRAWRGIAAVPWLAYASRARYLAGFFFKGPPRGEGGAVVVS